MPLGILPRLPVQDGVKFKHVPNRLGYCVGDDGFIWSCRGRGRRNRFKKWYRLKQQANAKSGHLTVNVHGDKPAIYCVHILVLISFVGKCPEGMECCHDDDNKLNNKLDNLRWDTRNANMKDAYRNGNRGVGEKHPCSKMTEIQLAEAAVLRKKRWSYQRLADRYSVSIGAIWNALNGVTWRHLQKGEQ